MRKRPKRKGIRLNPSVGMRPRKESLEPNKWEKPAWFRCCAAYILIQRYTNHQQRSFCLFSITVRACLRTCAVQLHCHRCQLDIFWIHHLYTNTLWLWWVYLVHVRPETLYLDRQRKLSFPWDRPLMPLDEVLCGCYGLAFGTGFPALICNCLLWNARILWLMVFSADVWGAFPAALSCFWYSEWGFSFRRK